MRQLRNHGDERQWNRCAHCGGRTESRDHVPSKVLLDEPFPKNLPRVDCCDACNQASSLDEEYVACLVDVAIAGSADPRRVSRSKVARLLRDKPALQERLRRSLGKRNQERAGISVEVERVRRVAEKLARGHAVFELNEPQYGPATEVMVLPLKMLGSQRRESFEHVPVPDVWPEVGSRAMQRVAARGGLAEWLEVQEGRYRYLAVATQAGILVRAVLSRYLAIEVRWRSQWPPRR